MSSVDNNSLAKLSQLRHDAENRLRHGTAPLSKGGTLSADALNVLYKLASSPDSAGEGLKLLHELQAYQVELDLQYEQLEANESQHAEELAHYKSLYEFAPAAYLVVRFDGQIIESNLAGARIFDARRDQLTGQRLDHFLAAQCRVTLASFLQTLHSVGSSSQCDIHTCDHGEGSSALRIVGNISPSGEAVLLMIYSRD